MWYVKKQDLEAFLDGDKVKEKGKKRRLTNSNKRKTL